MTFRPWRDILASTGKRDEVGQLSAGTTAARTISPVAFGGLQDDGPLPSCYAGLGARPSLSPPGVSLRRNERADHGKTVPPSRRVIDVSGGWKKLGKRVSFPAGWKNSRVAFRLIRFDMEY